MSFSVADASVLIIEKDREFHNNLENEEHTIPVENRTTDEPNKTLRQVAGGNSGVNDGAPEIFVTFDG